MAQTKSNSSASTARRGEATWLLPSNRKLRNLLSVSLRNLSLTSTPSSRRRGKTIDDDAVPQATKSPAKLVAMREQKVLGHSRSSTDLRAVMESSDNDAVEIAVATPSNGSPVGSKQKQRPQSSAGPSPRRPDFKRVRRRSTIEWVNATPLKRQQRLEDLTQERMADVLFTLHIPGIEGPIYVSETVERTMNPTFRRVDWTTCGPGITRLDQLTLRVWVRGGRVESWRQLVDLKLELSGLHYLSESLETLERSLPQNAILLHLQDGIYTSFTDSLSDYGPPVANAFKRTTTGSSQHQSLPTSSFDALLRLAKLDDSIQDALTTRNQIASELELLLEANKDVLDDADEVAEAEDRLKTVDYAQKTVQKQLEKARKQQEEKRNSIMTRRRIMAQDNEWRRGETRGIQQVQLGLSDSGTQHAVRKKAIQNQQRRICEELQLCYPILPLPEKTLAFSIRGLHLPNSENLDTEPPETICAALGYVAYTLQLMAFYLNQTLPYPVTPRGSTSSVYDPISLLKTTSPFSSHSSEQTLRTYPLFIKGVPRFRFEYAVFLINQNIRVLLESAFSLRVLDIRQTLPNLKYLLYVATAGEGELPARKAGGVRGLMRTPVLQRITSTDSTASGMSGVTLHENGKPKGAADRLREISGKGKNAMKM